MANLADNVATILTTQAQILTAIGSINTTGGTVNLQPALDAIAATDADVLKVLAQLTPTPVEPAAPAAQ